MSSVQFYLFRPMLRFAHWMQSRFPVDNPLAFVRFRRLSDRIADLVIRPPRGVRVDKAELGGVSGDWLIPEAAPDNPVIVFLHGGGVFFTWGSPHRHMLAYIARFAGLRAFGVDYRLLPEHKYPAAHDDCFTVYKTLVEQGKRVVLMGESTGGVLALATLLRTKSAGLPQPVLCVLISPTVDYSFKDERIWQSQDIFIDPQFVVGMHKHYTDGHDMTRPEFAPINADLSQIAPLYIMAGERELLWGEALRLQETAEQHQVAVELVFVPCVWHGWHLLVPYLPEATQSLKTLAAAIKKRID